MIRTPAALLPPDEAARLHSLRHYDILHSGPEGIFDELVAFSAHLFGLPVAYITLADADHLHFKAVYNLPQLPPQERQHLLCAQVIKHNRLVLYYDLAIAPQTPLYGPAIRYALAQQAQFYVGAPLCTAGQPALGTLCLLGQEPRSFSSEEQEVFACLGQVIGQLIAVRYHCRSTHTTGENHWQHVQGQLRDEVFALQALVRYLLTRYGARVPVSEDVLEVVVRRLQDLQDTLREHMASI